MALTKKGRVAVAGLLFLLPNFLGFLLFTSLPVLASLGLSVFEWDLFTAPKFVGLRNFGKLLGLHLRDPQNAPPNAGMLLAGCLVLLAFVGLTSGLAIWAFRRERRKLGWSLVGGFVGSIIGLLIIARQTLQVWWPNDPEFWYYSFNTVFMMLAIPVNMMGSLFLAMVMNQKLRGIVAFRVIYFMPSIVAGVGTYLLWRWIYNADYGMINTIIAGWVPGWLNSRINSACAFLGQTFFGNPQMLKWPPDWLSSIGWAKPALMLMGFWAAVGGYNMILYLAALQGVPLDLYEAADIDGANKWQKFWAITWPMVSPTTFFILTMSLIGGFQGGFEQAYVMTGGGPAGATTTISYYIYNHAFVWNHMGYAAAIAWVLFAAVFTATLLNWRFGGRVVHY